MGREGLCTSTTKLLALLVLVSSAALVQYLCKVLVASVGNKGTGSGGLDAYSGGERGQLPRMQQRAEERKGAFELV